MTETVTLAEALDDLVARGVLRAWGREARDRSLVWVRYGTTRSLPMTEELAGRFVNDYGYGVTAGQKEG